MIFFKTAEMAVDMAAKKIMTVDDEVENFLKVKEYNDSIKDWSQQSHSPQVRLLP
ncbi:hypothetical protein ES708_31960 [subsurface metagenome]